MLVTPPTRESLLHAIRKFPVAPMILSRLGRLVADMQSPMEDIVVLLKQDASLTARIIQVANSVVYSNGDPCGSLEEAVFRVGFKEIYRITGLAATAQIVDRQLNLYGVTVAQFRENAVLVALIMEKLASRSGQDQADAYTVGLLRSVGKIALDRWSQMPDVGEDYETTGSGPLADWELGRIGMTNGAAAEIIMKEWSFPAESTRAIATHYQPPADGPLGNLLHLAAGAAERCGHGWPGERFYWNTTPEVFAAAQVTPEDLDDATRQGLEQFGPVRAAVG